MSVEALTALLARANGLLRAGDAAGAVQVLEQATRQEPDDPRVLLMLGIAREQTGQFEAAEACLRRILDTRELAPAEAAEISVHLSRVLRRQGKFAEAVTVLETRLGEQPDSARVMRNLADALHGAGRPRDALELYRKASEAEPGDWQTWNNMALVLLTLENPEAAEEKLRRAVSLAPETAMCQNNLGEALLRQYRSDEALECFRRSAALDPRSPVPTAAQARILAARGDFAAAEELARTLPRGFPFPGVQESFLAHHLQRFAACDWTDYDATLGRIRELTESALESRTRPVLKPLAVLECFPEDVAFCNAVAAAWSGAIREHSGPATPPAPPQNARLRIAYASPDLRVHPVAFLLRDLLSHHDRERFEIVVAALGPTDDSDLARSICETADTFLDLSRESDAEAAQRLSAAQCDVLVDLAGYTADARPEIFAKRPAAVQVSYLGYFGSMQADWIEYLVAGDTLIHSENTYSEALLRLNPTPFAIDGFGDGTAISRLDAGLPEDAVVMSCFHRSRKFTPETFRRWMQILDSAPESVLWLRADTEMQRRNLRARAREFGIDSRLVFAGHVPFEKNIARQGLADLALDVPGFGGFNTNAIALWCGVPLLTLPGPGFASRVGAMALAACGLADVVAGDLDDYVKRAVELCNDRDALRALKTRAAVARDSALFDAPAATRRLERAFEAIVKRSRAGEPSDSLSFSD